MTSIQLTALALSLLTVLARKRRRDLKLSTPSTSPKSILEDANEHILRGTIARMLVESPINMREISHDFWDRGIEYNTHVCGKQPIDGIYATPDIDVQGFLALSFHESVGDHRTSLIDF